MWIKLTGYLDDTDNNKILVNTNNIACIFTGSGEKNDDVTYICFTGDKYNLIKVVETVDEIGELLQTEWLHGVLYE